MVPEPEKNVEETGTMPPPHQFESHEMRITQGGKIRSWVDFALKFFEENEDKALVLHTLPAAAKEKSKQTGTMEVTAGDDDDPQEAPPLPQGADPVNTTKKSGLSVSTITIPRLISVVEIIKREYLNALNANRSPRLVGLYQYNEMGSLEDNEREEEEEEDRVTMITEALAGTKK